MFHEIGIGGAVIRPPLRFAITSPPSSCEEDFQLQAVEHARRTRKWGRFDRPRHSHSIDLERKVSFQVDLTRGLEDLRLAIAVCQGQRRLFTGELSGAI